ncbi:hypothetical protein PG984_008665 [Apiospora sp. TS-2023a]
MQCEDSLMYPNRQTHGENAMRPVTGPAIPVIPAKRPDTETDDVQFISSKPVKRQKLAHPTTGPVASTVHVRPVQPQPQPDVQQVSQPVPQMGSSLMTPIAAAPIAGDEASWPSSEVNYSHDRRTTTGMVGLPSGFSDWEAIFGYRGCSLPELEAYSMTATRHKPAIISSPAISPKHIPQTLASKPLQSQDAPSESNELPQCSQTFHPSPDPTSTVMVNTTTTSQETDRPYSVDLSRAQREETTGAVQNCQEKMAESTPPAPHQSPVPNNNNESGQQQQQMPLSGMEQHVSAPDKTSQPHASKQPCKACIQMQQRAAFARAQGLPYVNPSMPLHMLPPGPYHPAFSPQAHPQFMPAMQAGMHPFGPGYNPMMMPMNMHNYAGAVMPSSMLSQQNAAQPMPSRPAASSQHHHTTAQVPEPGHGTDADMGASSATKPATATTANTSADTSVTTATRPESPAKRPRPPAPAPPHPSLLQPTYRKHSPNLIVDVAETCQEKFPFEAVAQRHDTTVEKVADVFAAIIQVPLLRCPKDRRRAGRLAHERVKEYNKTKRELQEAAAAKEQGRGGDDSSFAYGFGEQQGLGQPQRVVRPLDIANALGPSANE